MRWWRLSWCPGRWNKHRPFRGWHHVTRYRLYSSQGRSSRDCPTYRANTTGGLSIDLADFMETFDRRSKGACRPVGAGGGINVRTCTRTRTARESWSFPGPFHGPIFDWPSFPLISSRRSGLLERKGKDLAPRCYGGASPTPAPEGDPRRETRMILRVSPAVSR